MRKCILTVLLMMLVAGALIAVEHHGVFKSYDNGRVTLIENGKEKSFRIDSDAKGSIGKKIVPLTEAIETWKEGQPFIYYVKEDRIISAFESDQPTVKKEKK